MPTKVLVEKAVRAFLATQHKNALNLHILDNKLTIKLTNMRQNFNNY